MNRFPVGRVRPRTAGRAELTAQVGLPAERDRALYRIGEVHGEPLWLRSFGLLLPVVGTMLDGMGLPQEAVSLSPQSIESLHRKLCDMRHSVNNQLTLLSTSLELFQRKPEAMPRMLESLAEQPEKIRDEIARFSQELELLLGITGY